MVGVVCLIYAYRHPVRAVRHLGYSIYYEPVVLLAVIGSNYIQAVTDLEEGSQVIFIGSLVVLRKVSAL